MRSRGENPSSFACDPDIDALLASLLSSQCLVYAPLCSSDPKVVADALVILYDILSYALLTFSYVLDPLDWGTAAPSVIFIARGWILIAH